MIYLGILFSGLFLSNILLNNLLGLPQFETQDNSLKKPFETGLKSFIVALISGIVLYPIFHYVLKPANFEFLYLLFAVLIVSYAYIALNYVSKKAGMQGVQKNLDLTIPANAFIIGLSILFVQNATYLEAITHIVGLSLGYGLVLLMIYAIKPRLDLETPKAFKGIPILLVTLGLIAMVFMGLAGIF